MADDVVLNKAIDIAMYLVGKYKLGVPQTSREGFRLLAEAGKIDLPLAEALMKMVGFRDIAVHDYQKLDLEIVRSIIDERLGDFARFATLGLGL